MAPFLAQSVLLLKQYLSHSLKVRKKILGGTKTIATYKKFQAAHLVLSATTRVVGQAARSTDVETTNSFVVPSGFSTELSSSASTSHKVTFTP